MNHYAVFVHYPFRPRDDWSFGSTNVDLESALHRVADHFEIYSRDKDGNPQTTAEAYCLHIPTRRVVLSTVGIVIQGEIEAQSVLVGILNARNGNITETIDSR